MLIGHTTQYNDLFMADPPAGYLHTASSQGVQELSMQVASSLPAMQYSGSSYRNQLKHRQMWQQLNAMSTSDSDNSSKNGAIHSRVFRARPILQDPNEFRMRLRLTTRQADILLNLLRPDFLSAKWPGSVKDARVLQNSAMAAKFNGGWKPFPNAVLFGDFIYGASDWLVPMRPNAPPQFNTFYKQEEWWSAPSGCGRIVSRASRLAFVSKNPTYCCQLIKACGYLHNFLLNVRTEEEIDDEEFMGQLQDLNEEEAEQHTVNG